MGDTDVGSPSRRAAGQNIHDRAAPLARIAAEQQLRESPQLRGPVSSDFMAACVQDTRSHLEALAQALIFSESGLFVDYAVWADELLTGLGLPSQCLAGSLAAIREVLDAEDSDTAAEAGACLHEALQALDAYPRDTSPQPSEYRHSEIAGRYLAKVLERDALGASSVVRDAVFQGLTIPEIYEDIFCAAQREIGRLWHSHALSIAMEHYATGTTIAIMSEYSMVSPVSPSSPKFLGTCVQGERHDMGIRMTCDLLRFDGWQSYFLGADTPSKSLVTAVEEFCPDVVGLSASTLFQLSETANIIGALHESYPELRVVVGGSPFVRAPSLAAKVGADARAVKASDASVTLSGLLA